MIFPARAGGRGGRGASARLWQPVSGRQVVQLRLERNKPPAETDWPLPRASKSRSEICARNVGVSADAGFRLTPGRTQALTEIATAFFPRKVANLQAAFPPERAGLAGDDARRAPCRRPCRRMVFICSPSAKASRTAGSVDELSDFRRAVAAFRVELSDEYFNVEFTGKDIRRLAEDHERLPGAVALAGVGCLHAARDL